MLEDVAEYKSLGELFRRRLKDGVRPVDPDPAKIVSPCDGRVLHFGTVEEDGMLEQIKGWSSSLGVAKVDEIQLIISTPVQG